MSVNKQSISLSAFHENMQLEYQANDGYHPGGCLCFTAYYINKMVRPKNANMKVKTYHGMIKERQRLLDYAYNPNAHSKLVNLFCNCVSDDFPYNTEEKVKKAIIESYKKTWKFTPIKIKSGIKVPMWMLKDLGYEKNI